MLNLESLKSLSNEDLLELFTEKVECDHYDPFETSNKMKELYREKITQDELRKELLSRMSEK